MATAPKKPAPRDAAATPRPVHDPESYALEPQIGYVLRRAHQRATQIFNSVMGDFSVTPTQFAALAKIDDLGRVSQNELGRMTAMDPATIWGVVSRLIKQGFVVQSADPNDARLVMLELTETGREATKAMKSVAAEVSRETLAPFTEEEARQLVHLLSRLGG
jgi:MarR family transcriptional regulator, lower aerobic nicotinate degradation pathway regulator